MESKTATPAGFELATQKAMRERERDMIWAFMSGKKALLNSPDGLTHFHFLQMVMDAGDVLVFIDIPDLVTSSGINATDCNGIAYRSQNFRVHSENLFELQGSKFPAMLDNEIYQARVRRRRKPPANMTEGVKYLLDLTPASEGDDLVFQMAEMSLPSGVIKWWATGLLQDTPSHLVDGHDDVCSCGIRLAPKEDEKSAGTETENGDGDTGRVGDLNEPQSNDAGTHAAAPQEPASQDPKEGFIKPNPETLLQMQARGENELYRTPHYRNIPDYCRIRHCNSIIRLLMMIEGHNVGINSASRAWSMVAISKIFECPSVVRDRVAEWIVCQPKFVEILPEVAMRIGFILQLSTVTRMAFRILVNELALEEAAGTDGFHPVTKNVTVFGRRKDDVPDEMQNLVQHAARELTDRIAAQYDDLIHPDKLDLWGLMDWKKLRTIEDLLNREPGEGAKEALDKLKLVILALSYKVSQSIDRLVKPDDVSMLEYNSIDAELSRYVEPRDFTKLINLIPYFNTRQRLLCSFLYDNVRQLTCVEEFFNDSEPSKHPKTTHQTLSQVIMTAEDSIMAFLADNPLVCWKAEWSIAFSDIRGPCDVRVVNLPLINLSAFGRAVCKKINEFSRPSLRKDDEPEFSLFSHLCRHMLLGLDGNREMKFLPLWAGGCDDGSGGVFEQFLPPAEMGPNGPGPAYHTGLTVPSAPSSVSDSLLEDIRGMKVMGSTTAGSVDVHDSISTVYNPNRVIVAGSSVASEEFSENSFEYQDARFEVPTHRSNAASTVDDVEVGDDDDEEDMEFFLDSDDCMSEATEVAHVSDIGDAGNDNDDGNNDDDDDDFDEIDKQSVSSKSTGLDTDSDGDSVVLV